MSTLINDLKKSVKNWYIPLIVGILFVLLGFYVFTVPGETFLTLSVLFSLSFLVAGIFELVFAIQNKNIIPGWGWSLALGIMDVFLGILLLIHPEVSIATLPFFIGFMFMFRSISTIVQSFDLKDLGIKDWGGYLAVGIIGLILSFMLLYSPIAAGLTLVVFTGIAFIVVGISSIYISLRLKKVKDFGDNITKDLTD